MYIVSLYGISDVGGVERVTQYMIDAWQYKFDIDVIDFNKIEQSGKYKRWLHRHQMIDGIAVSFFVKRMQKEEPSARVVIQGYNAPFIKADLAFAHGTMRGLKFVLEGKNAKWHFNQLYEKIGMKNAKHVIAVAHHVKDEVISFYNIDEKKVEVIENCVDTNIFFPMRMHESKENNVCKILFVGRLEVRKGLNSLLEFAEIIENDDLFELQIATNNNANVELFEKFKRTTIVTGLYKQQMNEFYNNGSVMYFPSLYEGYEMVTTECLSAGIPVIGNHVGAVGDLYDRGQAGIEILSSDMKENLKKIITLSEHYSEMEMRIKLHNDMKQKYDLSLYKERLRKIWDVL